MRALTASEVDDLLNRNGTIKARVLEFEFLVTAFGWDDLYTRPGFLEFDVTVPGAIPPEGITFDDPVYGRVLIDPDPEGTLHFSAGVPPGAGQPVNPNALPNVVPDVNELLQTLALGAIAIGALWVVLEAEPWRHHA